MFLYEVLITHTYLLYYLINKTPIFYIFVSFKKTN
jgi:hypothetical protein